MVTRSLGLPQGTKTQELLAIRAVLDYEDDEILVARAVKMIEALSRGIRRPEIVKSLLSDFEATDDVMVS